MAKRKATFQVGAYVPPGTKVYLTFAQADARSHVLRPIDKRHKDRNDERRLPFTSEQAVYFKVGEEIEIDGSLDRVLANAFGVAIEDPAAERARTREAERQKRVAVKAAERALKDAAADAAEAEVTLGAAAPEDRPALQQALDDAKDAVAAAQSALTQAGG